MRKLFLCILLPLLLLLPNNTSAQWKGSSAPPYLADEIFRLSKECYHFKEFLLFKQNNKYYVLASFLNREAIGARATDSQFAKPVSPCGSRLQQLRLYRWISDKKVVFRDSVFLDKFSIALGNASDFDRSGSTKVIVNHSCSPPQRQVAPLLCYAFSIYGITKQEKLRNALPKENLPERFVNEQPQGYALEPVVTDNFDKSGLPECLAVDDFWEGELAFRADDFPKVTLVYTWDTKTQTYKNGSDKFIQRFTFPTSIEQIPDSISLVHFFENAMSMAAVGKHERTLTAA
jgi:hypothetical protein